MPSGAPAILTVHNRLLAHYGPQGWWPLVRQPGVPGAGARDGDYHPGDYTLPRDAAGRFEVGCGAVLTQNTAWDNAARALQRLAAARALTPEALLALAPAALSELIRPAGYHNLKARKLQAFAGFFRDLNGRVPTRDDLLAVWGIGPETADSILLYAYHQPAMVVDAYTLRILGHLRCCPPAADYETLRALCDRALPHDTPLRQEFHALMVAHGKRHYRRRPWHDPLLEPVLRLSRAAATAGACS
jgi:endonuclease-3 related protein